MNKHNIRLLSVRPHGFAVLLLALTTIAGCAAPAKSPAARSSAYKADDTLAPARNLERFAAQEERDASLRSIAAASPPGLEPHVLAPRPGSDRRARMPLDEALTEFAAPTSDLADQAVAPPREIEPIAQTAGQRHYIRGREAALAGRYYQAIAEFHRALEFDPDAVPVLRELARSHHALGNTGKAVEFYTRIAQIDPAHAEANFTLALSAAGRREWEQAAALLAGRYLRTGSPFDHDPAAEALAQFTFAAALRSLGYDRAHLEAARNAATALASVNNESMYAARLASVHRQQSELWRGVGDAYCRLGEYEAALEAYAIASVLPSPDPSALHPRVIFANLRLGRIYTAQYELLAALQSQGTSISDRDIRLCAYVADHVNDLSLLREEVMRSYRENAEEPDLARAAAALLPPDEAAALLSEYAARRPRDVHVVAELLTWFGTRNLAGAVRLAAGLIEAHPDLAGEYVTRLVFASPRPSEIIDHARALRPSPAAANIESRVLMALGALGEAWSVATNARQRHSHDRSLLWLNIELAALLGEPSLLRQVIEDANRRDDAQTWLFRARAHRALAQAEEAAQAAQRAFELTNEREPEDAALETTVLVERALSVHAYAASLIDESDRRRWAGDAAALAERVLERDPARESAYELLVALHRPNGLLANSTRFREIAERLLQSIPESRLYTRLSAEELLGRGRYEQALERLLNLYDSDPTDTHALALAIETWSRQDQLEPARKWLSEKLRSRPGDPALLEQWVTVMLRQERVEDVIHALTDAIEREPRNYAATRLLESAFRATGQVDKAFRYGEQRLLAMPAGVRRDVELAALYGGAGMERRAIDIIEQLTTHLDDATYEHLLTAIAILGRLENDASRRDHLTLAYAAHVVDRFPHAPLQVYGLALRAMAKLDQMDERFDALAAQAADQMPAGAGPQAVMLWRDLAQALVSDGEPAAAARALRPIIFAAHVHEPPASDVLAMIAFVADAACDESAGRAAETVKLIEHLAAVGRLPRMPGMAPDETPTVATTLYSASQIYSILANDAGVEALLTRALAITPNDAMVLNNLGYMRIEHGRDDRHTIEMIERAHRLEPQSAHVLDTIGWLRYRQALFDDKALPEDDDQQPNDETANSPSHPLTPSPSHKPGALSLIRAAIDASAEPIAEVHDHLGDTLWRLGRREEAIAAWEKAESLLADPNHRNETTQNLHALQSRGWGLLVADPRVLYDRMYGKDMERLRAKLDAVRSGDEPRVAPTFAELSARRAKPQAAVNE